MGIGAGVIEGVSIESFAGFRPGDAVYVDHQGAVYHQQDESGGLNVPYFEIQNTDDKIDFDITKLMVNMQSPRAVFFTTWGPTDFKLVDLESDRVVLEEGSGFDNTGWHANVANTSGALRVTQFDTDDGIDGTTAAWYPFVAVYDQE